METVVSTMPPFRHEFYAVAIRVTGEGQATTGGASTPTGSTIFFNTPFQIVSWDIAPNWSGYYVMFTQAFISHSRYMANLLEDFPFLRLGKSIPTVVNPNDIALLLSLYHKIEDEYRGDADDRFLLIETYLLLLLSHVRRYFSEQVRPDIMQQELRNADITLVARYQTLIEMSLNQSLAQTSDDKVHSVQFYADQLSVHPNHLNAVVKSVSGQTALQVIHAQLIQLAKTYLLQTTLTIQEIAYQLQFESPNYFSRFFKKHTNISPLQFRKQNRL